MTTRTTAIVGRVLILLVVLGEVVAPLAMGGRQIRSVTFDDGTQQAVDPSKLPPGVAKAIEDAAPTTSPTFRIALAGTMAPATVHVEVDRASVPGDWKDYDFAWSTGDAAADPVFWGPTGGTVSPSKGAIFGRSAGIYYPRPGTYTITLIATTRDGATLAPAIRTVTIPPDTRKRVTVLNSAMPSNATIAKAGPLYLDIAGDVTLKEPIDATDELVVRVAPMATVSAAANGKIMTFGKRPRNVVYDGGRIDGVRAPDAGGNWHGTDGFSVRGVNTTIANVRVKKGINSFVPVAGPSDGLLVWNCTSDEVGDYFINAQGNRLAVLFNDVAASASENVCRAGDVTAVKATWCGNRVMIAGKPGALNLRAGSESDAVYNVTNGEIRYGGDWQQGKSDDNLIARNRAAKINVWYPTTDCLVRNNDADLIEVRYDAKDAAKPSSCAISGNRTRKLSVPANAPNVKLGPNTLVPK